MDYVEEAWRIVDPVRTMEHAGSRIRAGNVGPPDRATTSCLPGVGKPDAEEKFGHA
jgi:hypothetical protein